MNVTILDEILQFWIKCKNFGWNVNFLGKMLLFWMKRYNFGSNDTVGQFRIWPMGYGPILILLIIAIGHMVALTSARFCARARRRFAYTRNASG